MAISLANRLVLLLVGVFFVLASCSENEPALPPVAENPLERAELALEELRWEDARQQAILALEQEPERAEEIIAQAKAEASAQLAFEQARRLFASEQYLSAFLKLQSIPEESAYLVRANNLSLRLRQAVALPVRVKRPKDGAVVSRVLLGNYMQGASKKEIDKGHALCEEYAGDCQKKWFTREGPRHLVTLPSFYMDELEVSVEAYGVCVSAGDCLAVDWESCGLDEEKRAPFLGASLPQVCVTWSQARSYCQWAGGDLPTEAQWEIAAGGGSRRFPWGQKWRDHKANFGDRSADGFSELAPVDAFEPYKHGLYNMSGNAYEWVLDWYDADYYSRASKRSPRGPEEGTGRVIKGGAFTRAPAELRTTHRNWMTPDQPDKTIGFRCMTPTSALP